MAFHYIFRVIRKRITRNKLEIWELVKASEVIQHAKTNIFVIENERYIHLVS